MFLLVRDRLALAGYGSLGIDPELEYGRCSLPCVSWLGIKTTQVIMILLRIARDFEILIAGWSDFNYERPVEVGVIEMKIMSGVLGGGTCFLSYIHWGPTTN